MGNRAFAPRAQQNPNDRPRLDATQRAVLDQEPGTHLAVHGAPGSGKTTTLMSLVAEYIDQRGWAPEDLVAIAADRRSASAVRDRIALSLVTPTRGALARTLGSLAFGLIQVDAVARARPAPRLLTGAEQDAIIAELLEGELEDGEAAWPETLDPEVRSLRGFRTELRELMMRLVETRTRPEELAELGRVHNRPEWIAAAGFIQRYELVLDSYSQQSLDSAEIIAEAAALIREGAVSAPRLIIVDDFQEQGPSALGFLRDAAAAGSTIIALGDPDVASATFRGSSPGAISRLSEVLGAPVTTLSLGVVHRHGAQLRSVIAELTGRVGAAGAIEHRRAVAAETLAEVESVAAAEEGLAEAGSAEEGLAEEGLAEAGSAEEGLAEEGSAEAPEEGQTAPSDAAEAQGGTVAESGEEPDAVLTERARGDVPVLRVAAATIGAEHRAIARVLREHHLFRGVPWARMAIIVRSSTAIPALARALSLSEVPTLGTGGTASLRERFAARQLSQIVALGLGVLPPAVELLTELLTGPFGDLDGIGLRRLRRALRHEEILGGGNRHSDDLLVEAIAEPDRLVTLDTAVARRAARLAASIADVRRERAGGASAEELLWTVWERSGLAKTWDELSRGTGLAADEANSHLDAILALFTSAKRAVERDPDAAAEVFIEAVLGAELAEDTLAPRSRNDTVWIGTPNAVVGSEYDIVVVARVQAGAWPNPTLRGGLLHPQLFSQVRAGLPVADIDARAEILSDELRMFALAASRARTHLIVSATESDDEQASPFTRFPSLLAAPSRTGEGQWPLNLRGLIGSLRRTLVTAETRLAGEALSPRERAEHTAIAAQAAASLARLAREGIAGATPQDWYGLRAPSTVAPIVDLTDPEARVRVSPSRMETFEKSPLNWFIEDVAATPSGIAAGIGTVVHAALERVGEIPEEQLTPEDFTVERLWSHVDQRWSELRFEAPWLGERERINADDMLHGVSGYLAKALRTGTALISAEGAFKVEVGQVVISGKIDRVERREDGSVVILDLKTGKRAPTAKELPSHAQLSAYQLALHEGAIPGTEKTDTSGGAALLYVRRTAKGPYQEHVQDPQDDDDRAVFAERVSAVGAGMAAAHFTGIIGAGGQGDPLSAFEYRIHLVAEVSA